MTQHTILLVDGPGRDKEAPVCHQYDVIVPLTIEINPRLPCIDDRPGRVSYRQHRDLVPGLYTCDRSRWDRGDSW